jgi:flavin-binding protein dodecin
MCVIEARQTAGLVRFMRESGHIRPTRRGAQMADSVYRVTEVIGVSSESWEAAARNAVETAAKTVRDLRIAEVVREDVTIENGSVSSFRVRLAISFKYDSGD